MAITGVFEADFSKFQTAVTQANLTLRGFQTNSEKVEAGLNRVGNSLSGQKVIQQASLMAKAVEDLGGKTKLTADELARVQSVANEAVAKFSALGQTAPKAIQDLATAGKDADNVFTGLGVSIGVAGAAAAAAVAAVAGLALGFGALLKSAIGVGDKLYDMSLKTGVSVEDLSRLRYVASQTGIDFDQFGTTLFKMEKFLGSTGSAADKAQESLTRLGLNLKTLKNENPGTAFVDIVSALEQVTNKSDEAAIGAAIFGRGWKDMAGLASENIRKLMADADALGLVMTTRTAAAAHAAEIGFKAFGMQLEAAEVRIASAFMPALVGLTQNLGSLFKDAVDGANASLEKMGGGNGFLATVARAMGTGTGAIAAQVKLYEYLRDALIQFVRSGVEPVVTAVSALMQVWDEALILGTLVALGYEKITYGVEGLLYYTAKLKAFGNPLDKSAAEDARTVSLAMKELGNTIADDEARIIDLKKNQKDWASDGVAANAKIEASLKNLATSHTDVAGIIEDFMNRSKNAVGGVSDEIDVASDKITNKFAKSLAELAFKIDEANAHGLTMTEKLKLFGTAAEKAALEARSFGIAVPASVQAVADAFDKAELDKIVARTNKQILAEYDRLMSDMEKSVRLGMKEIAKAWETNERAIATTQGEFFALTEKAEVDSLAKRLSIVDSHFSEERSKLDARASNYKTALAEIDATEALAAAEATAVWENHEREMALIANTIVNVFRREIDAIPAMLASIFTGGDFSKAVSAFTSRLGANLTSSLLGAGGALNGFANSLGSFFTKTLGQSIGGAFANIIPGIGGAIGSLLGPVISGVSGVFNKLFGSAGRDAVTTFAASFGGFDALQKKLAALDAKGGHVGETLWKNLTQGVGKNNPQQAQAAIDAINKALKGQDDYISRLPQEMQKYGLSWEQAGKQAEQAHLDEVAQGLIQDFADLSKAGFDVSTVTKAMSDDIDKYIAEAIRTGTEVPAAMKPLLQKMIDMGTLTDAAGNKITDLGDSGISFSETLTEGFQSVVDAIHDMVAALTGGSNSLSGALETIGNKTVSPRIKPIYDSSGLPQDYQSPSGAATYQSPSPTSAAPVGGSSMQVQLVLQDGRMLAETVVPYIPSVADSLGVGIHR
jgi:flagellar biosynthesis chaperone FliJ